MLSEEVGLVARVMDASRSLAGAVVDAVLSAS